MSTNLSQRAPSHLGCAISLSESSIVRGDSPVSTESVFADAIWNMASRVTLPGLTASNKQWNFSRTLGFPGGFALSLAEYAYARLESPVVTAKEEVSWLTVFNELQALSGFVTFCGEKSLSGFGQVKREHYEEFLKLLQFSKGGKSSQRIRVIIGAIYKLWDFRSQLGDGLVEFPFGKPISKLFKEQKARPRENATPVIPEPIFSAGSSIALDYVLEYSTTILGAWSDLREYWQRTLPQRKNLRCASRQLHIEAAKQLAKVPATWRKAGWLTLGDLYAELQQLRTSCMWVVLAFSGVRASELLSLEAGCCVSDVCSDGHVRHYINTKVHKYRGVGSKETWVVVEEVVKAIHVLEDLTFQARSETGDSHLFLTDGTAHFFSIHRTFSQNVSRVLSFGALLQKLRSFQLHCKEVLGRPIPEWGDGAGAAQPWKFNSRQFRRTLARYIVRQPFGVIAGMLQYKHIEVTIFEGYGGTEPEWNKLLADEKVLATIDLLDEVAMDLSNGELAGAVGQRLKQQFALEFKGRAEDFPPSQVAKWLASSAKPLFVGKFNFCFFDPTKAVCTSGDAGGPVLNHCQPDVCSNACVGKRHISKWEAQLRQAEEMVSYPKTSRIHREALSTEIAKLRAVVGNYGSNT